MLDPEKVGGFKIHDARDSRNSKTFRCGRWAKGGKKKKVEWPSNYPVCFYGFDRIGGINVAENEKIRKEKKVMRKVFNGIRFVIREIDSRIMELQTKKKNIYIYKRL